MTNPNLTEIVCILDRSGSMEVLRTETITAFNGFVEEQRKGEGEALLTLAQFDDEYQIDYEGVNVKDVDPLTLATYLPRGWTALNDAIGRTVVAVGERLAALPEEERPGSVEVLIITDGNENCSKDWTAERVCELVQAQTRDYNWRFTFMGGGSLEMQKAQASSLGIDANNSYAYGNNSAGMNGVFRSAARGMSRSRLARSKGVEVKASDSLLTPEEKSALESTTADSSS